ncbi:pleckstrin homology domain-containing family G member 3 isoform X1 [Trichomycterus rosablanca]|uniref:pleckstrin homology domain-containing family G member 3 isoform X1 n=1 Tax=Trichomycterus rosablanca TaxID=2290929 RepID=UPI002F3579AE
MAPNPELSYLDRVVMEIIETERTYVRDLRSIVEDYLAHIIDASDLLIGPEQVCSLFGNIEDIYEFNSELLQDLDQCQNDPVSIARCFVLRSDYFEIYTQYCTNYPNSVATLTECMRNKTLLKFFMERQEVLKHPLPLGSYLLKPVQRILKYHLLLQEISKHFNPDSDGYEVVVDAINTMTEVAWYINTMKRKHEHAVRLQEVQSLLIGWRGPDLSTYGELVLEGTFRFHHAKNDRTLFLLERLLLITKRRGENFIYKTHISCSTLMLMEGAKDSLCFSLTHYKHPKHPYTVQARTTEDKKLWTHHIKRLILENHHTVIPQKAKDAILEIDSSYPRSRFNAERKIKTQSQDFTLNHKSELIKHAVKHNKEPAASLKLWVSESELCTRLSESDLQTTNPHEILQQLRDEDGEPGAPGPQDGEQEEMGSDDGVNQEEMGSDDGTSEDFSRSMISCWSSRAQTLLQLHLEETRLAEGHAHPTSKEERRLSDYKISTQIPASESPKQPNRADHCLLPDSARSSLREDQEELKEEEHAKYTQDTQSSEEEEEEPCTGSEHRPILPSSVLDQAGSIVERFVPNSRRCSSTTDEFRSPRAAALSPGEAPDPLSPGDEAPPGSDRRPCRRRDSTLSTQERLIIQKIRSYYENAEQEDATFSLKRRESLTYIPNGLVRSSVSRINKIPLTQRPITASGPPKTDGVGTAGSEEPQDPHSTGSDTQQRPAELREETFRPSTEMIQVWEEMEREVTRSPDGRRSRDLTQLRGAPPPGSSRNLRDQGEPVPAEDLSTIAEESPAKVPGADKSSENVVFNLARIFSQNKQSSEAANQPRRRASETTPTSTPTSHLPPPRTETNHSNVKGKLSLTLPSAPSDQTGLPPQTPGSSSSTSSVRVLSPERFFCRSPPLYEGFHWPDVRELRSKYTRLEGAPLTPGSGRGGASRVQRGGSLDQKLSEFARGDYYVSARAPLSNQRTITVLEKHTAAPSRSTPRYSQVRATTPRDHASLLSVAERRRAYQDTEEREPRTSTDTERVRNAVRQGDVTQQGVVKSLREKFLNLG